MSSTKKKILNQLIYSEVFGYPLTEKEIAQAIGQKDIKEELSQLCQQNLILNEELYYTVFEIDTKIEKRKNGNRRAKKMLPKAMKAANFISKFPFIEGVGISGSLSKGVLMEDADFDFFIITEANRLWIARTLLILYKKIFLLNSRKFFCVNYFIDSKHLTIDEKNLFTATEIATLIPVKGEIFSDFYRENNWISDHRKIKTLELNGEITIKKPLVSKLIVFVLKNGFGEWLDRKSMHFTLRRWKKKFNTFESSKFDITMKSRPYVSKHHPNDFQNKVLKRYDELQKRFQYNFSEILKNEGVEQ